MKQQSASRLGLSHHQHTGHVLPRKTTSYPILVMLLLCVGVFLASWTRAVTADAPGTVYRSSDYIVHASVPGPPPSVAATVDSPNEGDLFTATPISVSGTCPNNTYVVVYHNGVMGGVALCDAMGQYHTTTDLFVGPNALKVIDYSFTDVAGPVSNIVNVVYQPPQPVNTPGTTTTTTTTTPHAPSGRSTNTATSGTPSQSVANPLVLHTDFTFQGFYVGDEVVWDLNVQGGAAPYAVSVEWGDGTRSLVSRSAAGSYNFRHKYSKKGGYHGSYAPIFSATDADGQQATLQLLSIISNRPTPIAAGSSIDNYSGMTLGGLTTLGGKNVSRFIKYVWPSYFVVVLMLTSFWLGERREYQQLKPRLRKNRHA
jgi:hypothetical protein